MPCGRPQRPPAEPHPGPPLPVAPSHPHPSSQLEEDILRGLAVSRTQDVSDTGYHGSGQGGMWLLSSPPAQPGIHRSCLCSSSQAGRRGQAEPKMKEQCLDEASAQEERLDQPQEPGKEA